MAQVCIAELARDICCLYPGQGEAVTMTQPSAQAQTAHHLWSAVAGLTGTPGMPTCSAVALHSAVCTLLTHRDDVQTDVARGFNKPAAVAFSRVERWHSSPWAPRVRHPGSQCRFGSAACSTATACAAAAAPGTKTPVGQAERRAEASDVLCRCCCRVIFEMVSANGCLELHTLC